MSTLKRAKIKSYNPATHLASVQVSGSLSVWLESIPVATDIPAAEVVAGRECALLLFTEDDPTDAVIVAVHGAVPAAPSAGASIRDADGNTRVETEAAPNEDKLRLTIAGVLRGLFQAASPHIELTGDLRLTGAAAIGAIPHVAGVHARIGRNTAGVDGQVGLLVDMGSDSGPGSAQVIGVGGRAMARESPTNVAIGLDYICGANGRSITQAIAVRGQHIVVGTGVVITDGMVFYARSPTTIFGTLTNVYGYYAEALNAGSTRYPFYDAGTAESGNARANVFKTSMQLFSTTVQLAGGTGVLGVADRAAAPSGTPSGGGVFYSQAGDPNWRSSQGVRHRLARRAASLTLANGANDDVALDGDATWFRVTGPTAAFSVRGLAGGEAGRMVHIYNPLGQHMTLANEDAGSLAANRIRTLTGAGVTTTGDGVATLVYDGTDSRWILIAVQGQ